MKKVILILLLALAIAFIGGCVTNDALTLAKKTAEVQAFMEQNPDATGKAVYLSQEYVNDNIISIWAKCGPQMEAVPYYYVTVTKGNQIVEIYTDEKAEKILCLIKPAAAGTSGGTDINGLPYEPPMEVNQTPLQAAEGRFEETVCGALPNSATRFPSQMITVGFLIPSDLDSKLSEINGTITLAYPNFYNENGGYLSVGETGEKYYSIGWFNVLQNGTSNTLIIPISATLSDESGGSLGEEQGAITMEFEGTLAEIPKDEVSSGAGMADGPGQNCWPYCNAHATPTYTRTSCRVDFEKPCETKTAYTLCGQCHYNQFIGNLAVSWVAPSLGQCIYCPSYARCDWGVVGVCGSVSCIGGGTTTKTTSYYASCGSCQVGGQGNYYYSGRDQAACRIVYQQCEQSSCMDMKSNC